jgi:hypothetical protein
MDEQRPWHRLFGLSWMDFFHGLPVTVEMERDLSVKKQLLDVLLIRLEGALRGCQLPDGFEDLGRFNLVSFKSYQEKLSLWSLLELIGHFVNLRKQVSPSMDEKDLLPLEQFRLYAVTARYPQQLVSEGVPLEKFAEGVYDVTILNSQVRIRIIVVNQLSQQEHNVLLHRFSTNPDLLAYAARHTQLRSRETTSLLEEFFNRYQQEKLVMPTPLEELVQEVQARVLKNASVEERLKSLSPEERLKGLPAEERLKGLPAEERLKGLPAEELRKHLSTEERLEGLSPEELVKGLSPETLQALAEKLRGDGPAAKPG